MRASVVLLLTLALTACPKDPYAAADADGDGWDAGSDCDDADASVYPGADEVCNGLDDDCDAEVDEDAVDASTWYLDRDADGYGDDSTTTAACQPPSGHVAVGGDCDDSDFQFNPGVTEDDCTDPHDYDCDGVTLWADDDGDGAAACEDCDDLDPAVHPGADEVCNGVDDDCDGTVDVGAMDAPTWYQDLDEDLYGNDEVTLVQCVQPDGYAVRGRDCDDTDRDSWPGADELCDLSDNDCDGDVDEDAVDEAEWWFDGDGDGYGGTTVSLIACFQPSGYAGNDSDCDDGDSEINPGATEVCNRRDDDCNGLVDDAAAGMSSWYYDGDGDGYGDDAATVTTAACYAPSGYVATADDCDDADTTIHPGATEVCNGEDDDCDGYADDADPGGVADAATWYGDDDGDGYGEDGDTTTACVQPAGYAAMGEDCDDADTTVHPGATETCDGDDEDCDGSVDEGAIDLVYWYTDGDGDGYGEEGSTAVVGCSPPSATGWVDDDSDCNDADTLVNPAADETCNGTDDDCDGYADDADPGGAVDAGTWYDDGDGDGYGDTVTVACVQPAGSVSRGGDCDDADTTIHPGATEVCNGEDDDCDGDTDGHAVDAATWYDDADGDGYGDPSASQRACTQPAGTSADGTDCNDTDASIDPVVACDWPVHLELPGASTVYLTADVAVTVDTGAARVSVPAGGAARTSLAAGPHTLRGSAPFVAHVVHETISGDMVATARGPRGEALYDTLTTWAAEHVVVHNPGRAAVTAGVSTWTGSTWGSSLVAPTTIPAGEAAAFEVRDGVHRVVASAPVTAWGGYIGNIENHFEYLTADTGARGVGEDFLWMVPEVIGVVGVAGHCVEPTGCTVERWRGDVALGTLSLSYLDPWTDTVTAGVPYEVSSVGAVLLRDESTPRGWTDTDGTCMDADLVPSELGEDLGVSFLVPTDVASGGIPTRRTDLWLMGYEDGAEVEVDEWIGGAWTAIDTVDLDGGDVLAWGTDLLPGRVLRFRSGGELFSVLHTHATTEYAWSVAATYYRDHW